MKVRTEQEISDAIMAVSGLKNNNMTHGDYAQGVLDALEWVLQPTDLDNDLKNFLDNLKEQENE